MKIELKGVEGANWANYKTAAMFVAFPKCSFKCDKENGNQICQNWNLTKQENVVYDTQDIVKLYLANQPISQAIVFGGLEPFDTPLEMYTLVKELRKVTNDPIIIYTGYTKEELTSFYAKAQHDKVFPICDPKEMSYKMDVFAMLTAFPNIIVKFGRFIPDQKSVKNDLLGVELASPNQYAELISI